MVEQAAVNRRVGGSKPSSGAIQDSRTNHRQGGYQAPPSRKLGARKARQQPPHASGPWYPGATRRLIDAYVSVDTDQPGTTPTPLPGALTARETEILRLVAAGCNNSEIAARLVVSPLTAKSHLSRILTKLGARDRTQLVIMAYESGLVVAGHPAGLRPPD